MKILVLSDVHANLPALESALASAPVHDAIWSLGDTVGYGANPNECLDLLAGAGAEPALVGNHDLAAVGLLPIGWFNVFAAQAAGWTSMQLTEENRFRIRSSFTSASVGEHYLVHGSPRDPARDYVQTLDDATDALGAVAARVVFCGHTHVPMLVELQSGGASHMRTVEPGVPYSLAGMRALINPGSVGQPRDHDPRASVVLLDTDSQRVTWHRFRYDVVAAQRAILDAGLPAELAKRLERGR
ncbi:MAG TPA: metallophosphoesterase family protein [Thermomicrobiales bacterium]|nr:metallophosphoesterase family protein [Thermomicrobiales bacterium]